MKAVAGEVGASPMGLYRHVEGRDDLLEAMLDERLGALELSLSAAADWHENVRAWMRHVRDHCLAHPEIFRLLALRAGGAISPAWLRMVGTLVAPLQAAGLAGSELASALVWVSRLTMGTLMQEVSVPVVDTAAVLKGLDQLAAEDALPWVDVLPELKRTSDDALFAIAEAQALAVVEQLTNDGPEPQERGEAKAARRKT